MKNYIVQKRMMLYLVTIIPLLLHADMPPPVVTLIFVIDQLAYDSLRAVTPHLRYGFKKLLTDGVVFTNAHHPHGMPATCTGHTALSTGAYGDQHGIVGNSWYDSQGNSIACDQANVHNAAVLSPNGTYDYGKSSHHIMVDGISDQFVLRGTPVEPHHAYSISFKSRAAIATANSAGIPIWFDTKSGSCTSSKAYVQNLPEWLALFNAMYTVTSPSSVYWEQKYPDSSAAYTFFNSNNYRYVRSGKPLINTMIPIGPEVNRKNHYELFTLTPQANDLIFDCAAACIRAHVHKKRPDRLLLWICASSLDKIGHQFGPESKEAIDMIYHLDSNIDEIMKMVERVVNPQDILYVLTSDHGISPIIEELHERGLRLGRRIDSTELIHELNRYIQKEYGHEHLVHGTKGHQLYLNTALLRTIPRGKRNNIIRDLQSLLESYEGIKKVWTHDELRKGQFPHYSAEYYFKQQLFSGRSGSLIMQVYPYTCISAHKYGTSHKTPYTHNTHVPLILYRKNNIQKKQISTKVLTLQLAPTLAHLLHVPQPSAAMSDVLPVLLQP